MHAKANAPPHPVEIDARDRPASHTFVGRSGEIAELEAALRQASAGRGSLVVLTGCVREPNGAVAGGGLAASGWFSRTCVCQLDLGGGRDRVPIRIDPRQRRHYVAHRPNRPFSDREPTGTCRNPHLQMTYLRTRRGR
jgi:hypothetical protein